MRNPSTITFKDFDESFDRSSLPTDSPERLTLDKCCVDANRVATVVDDYVEKAVAESLARRGGKYPVGALRDAAEARRVARFEMVSALSILLFVARNGRDAKKKEKT